MDVGVNNSVDNCVSPKTILINGRSRGKLVFATRFVPSTKQMSKCIEKKKPVFTQTEDITYKYSSFKIFNESHCKNNSSCHLSIYTKGDIT